MKIIIAFILLYLGMIDLKTKSIQKLPLIIMSILVVLFVICTKRFSVWSILGGTVIGLIMLVISLFTRQKLGLGDAYLILIMGVFLGFESIIILLLYALMASSIYSMILLAIKHVNRNYRIPFIPFILLGYIGVILS